MTVLLKECRDIQLRCGSSAHDQTSDLAKVAVVEMDIESDADKVISEHLVSLFPYLFASCSSPPRPAGWEVPCKLRL